MKTLQMTSLALSCCEWVFIWDKIIAVFVELLGSWLQGHYPTESSQQPRGQTWYRETYFKWLPHVPPESMKAKAPNQIFWSKPKLNFNIPNCLFNFASKVWLGLFSFQMWFSLWTKIILLDCFYFWSIEGTLCAGTIFSALFRQSNLILTQTPWLLRDRWGNQDPASHSGQLGDPEAELWQFVLSTLPRNHLTMSLTPKLWEHSHWLVKI